MTGVAERLDPEGTVNAALKLHRTTREILVIHDYAKTGLRTRNEVGETCSEVCRAGQFPFY